MSTILIVIIAATILFSLKGFNDVAFFRKYEFHIGSIRAGEQIRMVTSGFLHADMGHLFFNMFSLLVLGNPIEEALGKARFLVIFFTSLLTGSLASIYLNSYPHVSVGTSGAVFGLFGAFIALRNRINEGVRDIYVIVGLNFVFGFILGGVDWRAHLGGLIGGYLATAVLLRITRV